MQRTSDITRPYEFVMSGPIYIKRLRVALAVALIDVAIGLPRNFLQEAWKPSLVMLAIVMPAMLPATSSASYWIIGNSIVASIHVAAFSNVAHGVMETAFTKSISSSSAAQRRAGQELMVQRGVKRVA